MQSIAKDDASDNATSTTSNIFISSYLLLTTLTPSLQYPQFAITDHLKLPDII